MPTDGTIDGPAIPLARWADRRLKALASLSGSDRIAALDGATLVGERGSNGDYRINGRISAGVGGSRLMPTRDGGWFALTLIRAEDRELLPALFGDAGLDIADNNAIAHAVGLHECADLVARGRDLGLPVASADETPVSPPVEVLAHGPVRTRAPGHRLLVVDLSAIWAGPLAGHLFWLAGAEVVKVESFARPDLIRRDDHATFDLINQGKASVVIDFASSAQKDALVALIRQADVVIESSRPRALKHLGIDAKSLVGEVPGLVWLSVTGHGASGEAANWTGIGNDCAVAGGLSRALADVTGEIAYVGDAIADPLTGITGALEGWRALVSGRAQRIGLAMSAIVASAIDEERAYDEDAFLQELRAWGAAQGQQFPKVRRRPLLARVRDIGADNERYLSC
ncbi:CoA transferase [Novosphingobium sp. RD2P27]|uniref:CoA transferase n=1 Tax=Novosphingobium kalidii TaxID=3230299 RepID=A0ABV2D4F2_9SPHN